MTADQISHKESINRRHRAQRKQDLQNENQILSNQVGHLEEEKRIHIKQVKEFQQVVQEERARNQNLSDHIHHLEEENKRLSEKVQQLQQVVQEERASSDSMSNFIVASQFLQQNNLELENKLKRLEPENMELKAIIHNLSDQISTLQEDKRNLIEHVERLKEAAREERARNKNISDQISLLEENKKTYIEQTERLQQVVNKERVRNQNFVDQINRLRDDKKRLNDQVKQLEPIVSERRQENQNLSDQIKHLRGAKRILEQEKESLRRNGASLQKEKNWLVVENTRIHREYNKVLEENNCFQISHIGNVACFNPDNRSVAVSTNELGRGAYGAVYKGEYYGTEVAVKVYHDVIVSPYYENMLKREINIAARCRHPNLVLFMCATANKDKKLMIVSELMDMSLRDFIIERGSSKQLMKQSEISSVSLDVARGLDYLHSMTPSPVIHRDISSANVLMWKGDVFKAKISDYGSANLAESCKTKNPGAAIYAAPEASQTRQDAKLDVYSFGVLVCEMCISQLPDPDHRNAQMEKISFLSFKRMAQSCTKQVSQERPTMRTIIDCLQRTSSFPSRT